MSSKDLLTASILGHVDYVCGHSTLMVGKVGHVYNHCYDDNFIKKISKMRNFALINITHRQDITYIFGYKMLLSSSHPLIEIAEKLQKNNCCFHLFLTLFTGLNLLPLI